MCCILPHRIRVGLCGKYNLVEVTEWILRLGHKMTRSVWVILWECSLLMKPDIIFLGCIGIHVEAHIYKRDLSPWPVPTFSHGSCPFGRGASIPRKAFQWLTVLSNKCLSAASWRTLNLKVSSQAGIEFLSLRNSEYHMYFMLGHLLNVHSYSLDLKVFVGGVNKMAQGIWAAFKPDYLSLILNE